MTRIYIAAPFFNAEQVGLVMAVEDLLGQIPGLTYYSPRHDGVLKDMTEPQKKAAAPKLFALNVANIVNCNAVLALLDYSDTGTTWETGYAYGINKRVLAYRSNGKPLNIMLGLCVEAAAFSSDELDRMMTAVAKGNRLTDFSRHVREGMY